MAVGKECLPPAQGIAVTRADRSIIAVYLNETTGIGPSGTTVNAVFQDAAIIIGSFEEVGVGKVQIRIGRQRDARCHRQVRIQDHIRIVSPRRVNRRMSIADRNRPYACVIGYPVRESAFEIIEVSGIGYLACLRAEGRVGIVAGHGLQVHFHGIGCITNFLAVGRCDTGRPDQTKAGLVQQVVQIAIVTTGGQAVSLHIVVDFGHLGDAESRDGSTIE